MEPADHLLWLKEQKAVLETGNGDIDRAGLSELLSDLARSLVGEAVLDAASVMVDSIASAAKGRRVEMSDGGFLSLLRLERTLRNSPSVEELLSNRWTEVIDAARQQYEDYAKHWGINELFEPLTLDEILKKKGVEKRPKP